MEFKKRNNDSIKKQEFLDFLFKTIDGNRNPVDLKHADIYVIVEIFKNLLVFAVVPRYRELKKYNLS
jgi:tRNA(Ser,Leu) C12 N-acetylase TAN1